MDSMPPESPRPESEPGQPQPYTPPQSGYAPYAPEPERPAEPEPPQAYVPPAQAYAPPPAQPPMQPYGQGMPPVQAPARRGFPWLACCGISCVVALILAGGAGFCAYQMGKPIVQMTQKIATLSTEVKGVDAAVLRKEASPVKIEDVQANPGLYEGKWVAVEGTVAANAAPGTGFSGSNFSNEQATCYTLTTSAEVLDLSQAPALATPGQRIRAYGKIYVMDLAELGKMPFVGPAIEQEMKKNPEFQQNSKIIMVIAKEVELAAGTFPGVPKGGTPPPPPQGQASQQPVSPVEEQPSGWDK